MLDETTEPTRKRSHGRALIVLAVIVGVLVLLIGLYVLTLGRSPLAGPRSHDFGYVTIEETGGSAEHTFTLTNRTNRTLHLGPPRASCGCTVSELSAAVLEPGEDVSVTAELTLTRAGQRSSDIIIPIEGWGVRRLYVTGIGRPANEIHSRRGQIPLWHDHEAVLGFTVDAWPDVWDDVTALARPDIITPVGVRAELVNWSMTRGPDRDGLALWQGRISLILDADVKDLPPDAAVTVTVRDGQQLRVPLVLSESRE